MKTNYKEKQSEPVCIEVQETGSIMGIVDKVADLAIGNKDAGLVLASALATSIIIWVITQSAVKLIRSFPK
ncbi:MAG: hypothetical protein ACRCU2_14915 [Planktothrix sp.]